MAEHECPNCGNTRLEFQIDQSYTVEDMHIWASCPECFAEGTTRSTNEEALEAFCHPPHLTKKHKEEVAILYKALETMLREDLEDHGGVWDPKTGGEDITRYIKEAEEEYQCQTK